MAGIWEGANKDVAQRDLLRIQVLLVDTSVLHTGKASDLNTVSMLGRYSLTMPETGAREESCGPL